MSDLTRSLGAEPRVGCAGDPIQQAYTWKSGRGSREGRCPFLLLLDGSGSMAGEAIAELNRGLVQFQREIGAAAQVRDSLDVGLVRFASAVEVLTPMAPFSQLRVPALVADGETPMGAALELGLTMLLERQDVLKAEGRPPRMPWLVVMSDGNPTDDDTFKAQAWRVRSLATMRELAVLAIGIGKGADLRKLGELTAPEHPPVRLEGLRFAALFSWLAQSLKQLGDAKPGEMLALPPPGSWSGKG